MTIIIFAAVLFVLILVHEWGHFIAAKKTGMRVDEFGIGFPPRALSFKKGETVYSLNWLPIGGFVSIFGENAEDVETSGDIGKDNSRAFGSRPKWAQAIVLVAGVTMNILFAWLLFVIVAMMGTYTPYAENNAPDSAELVVAAVMSDSPAENAGIPAGSVITKVSRGDDSLSNLKPSDFRNFTNFNPDSEVTIDYVLKGKTTSVSLKPAKGINPDNPDTAVLGVSLVMAEKVSKPFFPALIDASLSTYYTFVAIVVGVFSLLADSLTLSADMSAVAGPVGIVGMVGDAAAIGITSLLIFTATISLNLAVINMLPFPALDGGRLLFVLIEAVTKRRINPVWVMRVNTIGFVLLIALMVAVTYNDILRII